VIISASRRTDIPAFYSDWFLNRITDGYVKVKNPYNPNQINCYKLDPDSVDGIVFWTKNPQPILDKLTELKNYNYYFLFTLNAYNYAVEPNLPPKAELIDVFRKLSDLIGSGRVIWRYDPILYSLTYNRNYHLKNFKEIASQLQGYTHKCIISFIDIYQKNKTALHQHGLYRPSEQEACDLLDQLWMIASNEGIFLQTCGENLPSDNPHTKPGKCIDNNLLAYISGKKIVYRKDKSQRKNCLCQESIDIGSYNSCQHRCLYCYAKGNMKSAQEYYRNFSVDSESM